MALVSENPLVSICIPTYNGERYLQECFDSILAQTYTALEIIISDDGSTDSTLDICNHFKSQCIHPVTILNHETFGLAKNWNYCYKNAHGEYIKYLFQDDILKPECISEMVRAAQNIVGNAFVFSDRDFIVSKDEEQSVYFDTWIKKYSNLQVHWRRDLSINASGYSLIQQTPHLFSYPLNKVGEPSTTLISKKALERVDGFDEDFEQLTDVQCFYNMFPFSIVRYIDKNLVSVRLHQEQATVQNVKQDKADEDLKLYYSLKQKHGRILHKRTMFFPIKYKVKKILSRIVKKRRSVD